MIAPLTLALLLAGSDQAALRAAAASTCAAFPLRKTGTIRYFCDCQTGRQDGCVPGEDANLGDSPGAPRRTWEAARAAFNAMNAGDTIALCRGGAWAVTSTAPAGCVEVFANPRCARGTASLTDPANPSTCDLRDYAPPWGGTARPLLAASTASPTRILAHGGSSLDGVRILNLAFQGGNAGPNGGVYHDHRAVVTGTCNDSNDSDWLVCNDSFDRLYLGLNLAEGSRSTWNRFLVWGNSFTMHDLDAMLLGTGADNRIDANLLDDNGGFVHPVRGNQAHTIYLSGNWLGQAQYTSTNLTVANNEFRRSGEAGTVGPAGTPTFVGHEMYDGVLIENNLLDCGSQTLAGCWAMSFSSAQTCPTFYRHLTIRRNWINAGGVGIAVGQAPGVVIEDNVITMLNEAVAWKQGIITPLDSALPAAFYTAAEGQSIPIGDPVQDDSTVRNNTIYVAGANAATNGIAVGREGKGHVIANNVVYAAAGRCFATGAGHCSATTSLPCDTTGVDGRAPDGSYTPGCPSGESCVEDAAAYGFVGNNACFGGAAWGTTHDTTTHLTADPLFVSPPGDLSLQPLSPLLGAGSPAYAPALDFQGNARPATPSIGAYDVGGRSSGGGSSSSGGSTGGGGGSRGGCGTSGEVPGALGGLLLLALASRRGRSRR